MLPSLTVVCDVPIYHVRPPRSPRTGTPGDLLLHPQFPHRLNKECFHIDIEFAKCEIHLGNYVLLCIWVKGGVFILSNDMNGDIANKSVISMFVSFIK